MSTDSFNLPVVELNQLANPDGGEIRQLKYRPGSPRSFRFDASKGRINFNGEDLLTKSGEPFSFVPIAWRTFRGNLFEKGVKQWAEMFYINRAGILCSILFHGFSVESLLEIESELFYDDLPISAVVLTMTPELKTSKKLDDEGRPKTFYIAKWAFKPAPADLLEQFKSMTEKEQIFRLDTFDETHLPGTSWNYAMDNNYLSRLTEAEGLPELDEPEEVEEKVAREAGKRKAEK